MPRALEQLEAEALELPEEARIRLMERLLRSFGAPSGPDAAIAREWAEEAERRDASLDHESQPGLVAEEVFERIDSERK